jgi:putative transposase
MKEDTLQSSWFKIEKKTSKQTPNFPFLKELERALETKPVPSEYKTLKLRIFPDRKFKEKLKNDSDIQRYFYNDVVSMSHSEVFKNYKYFHVRDMFKRKYVHRELLWETEKGQPVVLEEIRDNSDPKKWPIPEEFGKVHNKIIRGGIKKFCDNYRSALSNYFAGNNKGFTMRYKRKKEGDYLHFEDDCFPIYYKNTKAFYGYRTKEGKRRTITVSEIIQELGKWRSCTYIKNNGKYFLLLPVPKNYFPDKENNRRNENQVSSRTGKVISLDPGVRKFLTGYSPSGEELVICRSNQITKMLLQVDKLEDLDLKRNKWEKIKNYINDLHWKSARYLVSNYDIIILGDISTQSICKGKRLSKMVKRVINQYSFHQFKLKLSWLCERENKKLILTEESYTSKTCCVCGELNDVGKSELYSCSECKQEIDRDLNGAINILQKTITLSNQTLI